jgi:hypothetical protein
VLETDELAAGLRFLNEFELDPDSDRERLCVYIRLIALTKETQENYLATREQLSFCAGEKFVWLMRKEQKWLLKHCCIMVLHATASEREAKLYLIEVRLVDAIAELFVRPGLETDEYDLHRLLFLMLFNLVHADIESVPRIVQILQEKGVFEAWSRFPNIITATLNTSDKQFVVQTFLTMSTAAEFASISLCFCFAFASLLFRFVLTALHRGVASFVLAKCFGRASRFLYCRLKINRILAPFRVFKCSPARRCVQTAALSCTRCTSSGQICKLRGTLSSDDKARRTP